MNKIMTLMLGLSMLAGTTAVFAKADATDTTKTKKTAKSKKAKKTAVSSTEKKS